MARIEKLSDASVITRSKFFDRFHRTIDFCDSMPNVRYHFLSQLWVAQSLVELTRFDFAKSIHPKNTSSRMTAIATDSVATV